jgi:DnaD/phage-associated family protein
MLGTLLARFDDERVLKVVLRAIWHVHQKKGAPRPVTVREIAADSVMSEALGLRGEQLTEAVAAALVASTEPGAFVETELPDGTPAFVLNTHGERDALVNAGMPMPSERRIVEAWDADSEAERPNIFTLYERNIGELTPIIAERLRETSAEYPESWIAEAIEIGVQSNVRNMKYVIAILKRWQAEGKGDGKPRRDPEEVRQDGYRRAFDKYVRDR